MHRSLYIVGITILLFSFRPVTLASVTNNIMAGEYYGLWLPITDNPFLQINTLHSNINVSAIPVSVYVLQYNDSIKALESGSLNKSAPVFKLENITYYSGLIELPSPGTYVLFVTTFSKVEVFFTVIVTTSVPQVRLLVIGILTLCFGAGTQMYPFRKRVNSTPTQNKNNSG